MAAEKPYHHPNLREELLRCALDLIRETGPQGFTLREVARRAGVSHTAPYRHFSDKNALLGALVEEGFRRLISALKAASAKSDEPLERYQQASLAYVRFALEHPEHFQTMFAFALDSQPDLAAQAAAEQAFGQFAFYVEECVRSQSISCIDALTIARIAWSTVHGIATLAIHQRLGMQSTAELVHFTQYATMTVLAGMKMQD